LKKKRNIKNYKTTEDHSKEDEPGTQRIVMQEGMYDLQHAKNEMRTYEAIIDRH